MIIGKIVAVFCAALTISLHALPSGRFTRNSIRTLTHDDLDTTNANDDIHNIHNSEAFQISDESIDALLKINPDDNDLETPSRVARTPGHNPRNAIARPESIQRADPFPNFNQRVKLNTDAKIHPNNKVTESHDIRNRSEYQNSRRVRSIPTRRNHPDTDVVPQNHRVTREANNCVDPVPLPAYNIDPYFVDVSTYPSELAGEEPYYPQNVLGQEDPSDVTRTPIGESWQWECPDHINTTSTDFYKRTPCPMHYVTNDDPKRIPRTLVEIQCSCTQCRTHGAPSEDTACTPIKYYVQVLRISGCTNGVNDYAKIWLPVTVGCVCASSETQPMER